MGEMTFRTVKNKVFEEFKSNPMVRRTLIDHIIRLMRVRMRHMPYRELIDMLVNEAGKKGATRALRSLLDCIQDVEDSEDETDVVAEEIAERII